MGLGVDPTSRPWCGDLLRPEQDACAKKMLTSRTKNAYGIQLHFVFVLQCSIVTVALRE